MSSQQNGPAGSKVRFFVDPLIGMLRSYHSNASLRVYHSQHRWRGYTAWKLRRIPRDDSALTVAFRHVNPHKVFAVAWAPWRHARQPQGRSGSADARCRRQGNFRCDGQQISREGNPRERKETGVQRIRSPSPASHNWRISLHHPAQLSRVPQFSVEAVATIGSMLAGHASREGIDELPRHERGASSLSPTAFVNITKASVVER